MSEALEEQLGGRAFPALAAAVRAQSETILARWDAAVRKALPKVDSLSLKQLRDSLPDGLRNIADALDGTNRAAPRAIVDNGRRHGETRFRQQFDVDDLIVESRLLSGIVLEAVWDAAGPLDREQAVALNAAVQMLVHGGIAEFANYQTRKIREASESESRNLSYLSHDLRNHLNHATLVLQLVNERLIETPGAGDIAEDIADVQRAIFETVAGMDRLLQAERLKHCAVQPRTESVDLQKKLHDHVTRAQLSAEKKGLLLAVHAPQKVVVQTDLELISLVLQNLIGNAIKYSAAGTITVRLQRDGERWAIAVVDEGPGIAPERLATLFQAFQRGETHGESGVGLGLSIAASAAELLGGELRVASEVGRGSTFTLLLPA